MRIVKIITIACALIMLVIPVVGATTNNPDSSTHNCCRGWAFGEIEDYKLSLIAQLIYLLRGEPSALLVTRATLVIRQEPDMMSLDLIDPIKHCCIPYFGNITIHFYASIAKIKFDPDENCNCTLSICSGFFGIIQVEQN